MKAQMDGVLRSIKDPEAIMATIETQVAPDLANNMKEYHLNAQKSVYNSIRKANDTASSTKKRKGELLGSGNFGKLN